MYQPFVLDPESMEPSDDVDLVLFPEFIEDGVGIYRSSLVPMKKELAERGIRAEFAFPPDKRTWLRELSAGEYVVQFVIGLGASGTVAMLQHLVTRTSSKNHSIKVKVTRARKVRGRRMWDAEFVEFEGSAEDVLDLLDRWEGDDRPDGAAS